MKTRLLFTLGAFAATIPSAAAAGNWMLVGAEGAAPDRRHLYAEFDRVSERYDGKAEDGDPAEIQAVISASLRARDMAAYLESRKVRRLRVIEVLEQAAAPDTVEYLVSIQCTTRQYRIVNAVAWQRNGQSSEIGGAPWAPIPGNWVERVRLLVCEPDKTNKAIKVAQRSGKPDPLAKLGLVYIGDMLVGTELSDVTWANFWRDGKRPAYASTDTPEELEARKQAGLASLRQGINQLEHKAKEVEEDLAMQEKMAKAQGSANAKYFQEMQGTAGWSEEKVVARWGQPQGFSESNSVRRLTYYFQDTTYDVVQEQMDVIQCQGGACNKVGETGGATTTRARVVNCERTLFLKQGGTQPGYRLFDFHISCN